MHTTPMQQTLFPHPEARLYTASSIDSSSPSSASHGGGYGHGPTLDHPAHVHIAPVWKLVHTHDAIYAPVPPSLVRKRPALLSARSSSCSTSLTSISRGSSPWYDYDEFNDHPQSQRTSSASSTSQRAGSPAGSQ